MLKRYWIILLVIFILPIHIFAFVFNVGYAERDITPSKSQIANGEIYLGGYGLYKDRGAAIGIKDHIYSKSLSIENKQTIMVITSLDLPGISNKLLNKIRDIAHDKTQIPKEHLFIGVTHTHAGPDLMGLWGGVSKSYKETVINEVVESIVEAYQNRQPSRLYISENQADNYNRRGLKITDNHLSVIDAISLMNGNRIATLINFGTHPIFVDEPYISRDYCGYLVDYVSERLDAPVLFMNGIMGDVVPPKKSKNAQTYGESIGKAVLDSISNSKEIEPTLVIKTSVWKQHVTNPIFILATGIKVLDFDMGFDFSTGFYVKTRASYFRLGNAVQGVTFPGESLSQNGLSIKENMKAPSKLFLGLTGDTLGYFIPSYDWNVPKKNYEETLSLGRDAGDIVEEILSSFIKEDNKNF